MFKIDFTDNHMYLTKGDSAYFTVDIKDQCGTAYTPSTEDRVVFTVKGDTKETSPILIEKTVTIEDEMRVHIIPSDTKSLTPGDYFYDVQIFLENGDVNTMIAKSVFTIGVEVG